MKRKDWEPGKTSSLCSAHFIEEDFTIRLDSNMKRCLKSDEIGISVYPTIHAKDQQETEQPPSKREKRMIVRSAKSRLKKLNESGPSVSQANVSVSESIDFDFGASTSSQQLVDDMEVDFETASSNNPDSILNFQFHDEKSSEFITHLEKSTQTLADHQYRNLDEKVKRLKSQLAAVRKALQTCKGKNRQLKRKVDTMTHRIKIMENKELEEESSRSPEIVSGDNDQEDEFEEDEEEGDTSTIEEEPDYWSGEFWSESGTETETEDEDMETSSRSVPLLSNNDIRTEPKYIVFLSKLLVLFQFCFFCRGRNPQLNVHQTGTSVTITAKCSNIGCMKEFSWTSQPVMPGTRIPAGNFLVCMAVLFAGGSFTKVVNIFSHMGLACISLNTFFRHQRTWLFPTLHLFWKQYQENLFTQLKALGGLTISGDGRHDSMGHSAKYCAYTIFCCTLPRIIHFVLIQRNQAGNSPAMEFMGFQQCMGFLLGCGLSLSTFISDRHTQIASHMKNSLTQIKHYFDLWHLKKKITKLLSKISKEKGNEEIKQWVKSCERHLYWSATSTSDGNGQLIWAKFKSFLSHVVDKHENLDEPLFNKCAHAEIPHRKWIDPGYQAFNISSGCLKQSPTILQADVHS